MTAINAYAENITHNITADVMLMYATSDNFPEESVKTVLDSLENSFGIKFNYDFCILNYEDKVLRGFAAECPAKVVFFSSKSELSEGFYLDGDIIMYAHDGSRFNIREYEYVGIANHW